MFNQAETLDGVVVSGRPCLSLGNAGVIHQHPLLFGYIGYSVGRALYRKHYRTAVYRWPDLVSLGISIEYPLYTPEGPQI